MPHQLPPLPYAFAALEPHIDARTLELHHAHHHRAHVQRLNRIVTGRPELAATSAAELLGACTTCRSRSGPRSDPRPAVITITSLLWSGMSPDGGGRPDGELARAIGVTFGGFAPFQERFAAAAAGLVGSGWVWLALRGKQLEIVTTANHDSPLLHGKVPLLCVDLWERAYYLHYHDRRHDYVAAWWNVVHWDGVAQRYAAAGCRPSGSWYDDTDVQPIRHMSHNVVPVTMGSPEFHTVDVGPLRATEALFPPSAYLAPHVHARPIVAVILDGSWEEQFTTRTYECMPGTVLTEPAGERHANRFQQAGARVLVIEPDPALADLWRPAARLLDSAGARVDVWVAGLAQRAAVELRSSDSAAPLALEGLAFEILAGAARSRLAATGTWPDWLGRARELLHDQALEPLRLTRLAGLLGVQPAHLARLFRARFGMSVGAYQRQLRLEWAGRRLVETRETLAQIALDSGFADQSHFTRAFKRYAGVSPGRYRQTRARGISR